MSHSKKSVNKPILFLFLVFIVFLSLIPFALSQPIADGLEEDVKTLFDGAKRLAESNERKAFLIEQWEKIFLDTKMGKITSWTLRNFLNPLFELILKQKFTFSLLFLYSLFIWLILVDIIQFAYKVLELIASSRWREKEFFATLVFTIKPTSLFFLN